MYKSPIEIIYGQMQQQIDGEIFRAVQNLGVSVDKEELIKALAYDRNQYDAGYRDAMATIVRCEDCAVPHNRWTGCPHLNGLIPPPDFYCARGERKEGADYAEKIQ